ncbi:MAG: rRNA adenine N-6-methyltransferase family protein [Pyrinomonadaceae bacterium]
MKENIEFLQAFIKNPLKVGAITPSSPELARQMLKGIKPDENNIILELGVGTGAITKVIEEVVPDEKSYLGVELDGNLVNSLNVRFPRMKILRGNACELDKIHKKSNLGKVSYIISCLPFVSMPNDVGEKILSEIENFMEHGCMLRTFQYAHGFYMPSAIKLREFMRRRYGKSQKSPLIVKNVPPAYVLTWQTKHR